MIVLRSNLLPEALEDSSSTVKKNRQSLLDAAMVGFSQPEKVRSLLEDLPVAKAMNSYVKVVDGRLELAPGETGIPKSRDQFTFQFWPISTRHVNIINSIFLDNILHCGSVAYNSRAAFRRTLEAYLTTRAHGFKQMDVGEHGAKTTRRACLGKLAIVLKKLGVENVSIVADETGKESKPMARSLDEDWLKIFTIHFGGIVEAFESKEDLFWQTYRSLGIASGLVLPFVSCKLTSIYFRRDEPNILKRPRTIMEVISIRDSDHEMDRKFRRRYSIVCLGVRCGHHPQSPPPPRLAIREACQMDVVRRVRHASAKVRWRRSHICCKDRGIVQARDGRPHCKR
jgi:hypothetical protein